jgi:hypothetical protein
VDESRFWGMIDATLPAAADRERQEDLLWQQLIVLPPEEVAAFAWLFDRQIDRSDCDNVEVAFALISGVGSDDGYHDFRCWLVSRGRVAFEAALADPDSLSEVVTPGEDTRSIRGRGGTPATRRRSAGGCRDCAACSRSMMSDPARPRWPNASFITHRPCALTSAGRRQSKTFTHAFAASPVGVV